MLLSSSFLNKGTLVLILNLLFVVIFLLTFLRGFIRGVRKSAFYTILLTIGVIVMWLLIYPLSEMIYTMDLSFTGVMDTSLKEYVFKMFETEADFVIVKDSFTYEAVNGLILCVIQFVVFFVSVMLFQFIGKGIIHLLWLLIGRRYLKLESISDEDKEAADNIEDKDERKEFLEEHTEKKTKYRLWGGVVGLVNGLVLSTLLCVPLSGIFSFATSIRDAAENSEQEIVPEEIEEYYEYIDIYDETWMGQFLGIFGEDGLDNALFDTIFSADINKYDVKLRKNVKALSNFAIKASESGILSVDTENLSAAELNKLDTDTLSESFKELKGVDLLDVILNVGVDFLEYSDFIKNHETLSDLVVNYDDLRKVKLSKDISQLGKVVSTAIDILQDQEDLTKIDYMNLNPDKLTVLVEELFDVELINVGIDTGLSYALSLDEVVEFVGDNEVNYENIDWEQDLKDIIDIYKEFVSIGIEFDSDSQISVQLLSNNTEHIQNIIDKLYSLDVFTEVKDIAVNLGVSKLEENQEIAQYIPEEVMIKLKDTENDTIFKELSTVINLFKDLGEKTTLLESLDEYLASEDENKVFVLDVKPELVYIMSDYIEQSEIATPIVMNFVEISNDSMKESMGIDLYESLSKVDNLSVELNTIGHILEGIEAEDGNLNQILADLTGSAEIQEIDLALINGIINEDKATYLDDSGNICYYIDDSVVLKQVVGPILDTALKELIGDEKVFSSEDFEWSREITALSELATVLADTTGTPGKLNISKLTNAFQDKIHIDILKTLNDNVGDTQLISKFINVALKDVVDAETLNNITDWEKEISAFYQVANTLTDDEGYLRISELQSLNEIKVNTLNVAADVINDSSIIKHFFKEPLVSMGVNPDEIINWNDEMKGLVKVVSTIATKDSEGNDVIVLDQIENSIQSEIPLATIKAVRDIYANSNENTSTVIITTLFKDALVSVVPEEGFFDNWTNAKWSLELGALTNVASTLAEGEVGEEKLVIANLSNMDSIKMSTINVASTVANDSTMIQYLFKDPLNQLGVNSDEITNWNVELSGLAKIVDTIAVENENGEKVLEISSIETSLQNEIPLATLEAAAQVFKDTEHDDETVILKTLLTTALETTVSEEGFFDNWTNSKWSLELGALTNVATTLAEGEVGEEKLVIANLSNMEVIYIATLDSMNSINEVSNDKNIDSSSILQYIAKEGFGQVIGADKADLIGKDNESKWSYEVEAIKAMTEDYAYVDTKGRYIRLVSDPINGEESIDKMLTSSNSDKIKWEVVNKASEHVRYSLVIRTILDDPFKQLLEVSSLDWDVDRWELEVTSVALVTEKLQDSEGYISTSLSIDRIPTDVLYQASQNTLSLVIRKIMSDSLTSMYDTTNVQDMSQVPSTWNDERWENEITALYQILYAISDGEYIDINAGFLHREIKLAMFDEMEAHIKYSTVLQSKIAQEVYTEGGTRIQGTPLVEYGSEGWHNEMMAVDKILHTIPEDDTPDAIVSYDSLNFVNIKFVSLETARDYIHDSVLIQHKMFISLEGIQGVKLEQYEFSTTAQWYNEVNSIINIAKAYVGYDKTVVNLDDISFSSLMKMSVLKTIADNIHHTTFMQSKLDTALFSSYTAKPEIGYTYETNQWNFEINALHNVGVSWFGENGEVRLTTLGNSIDNGFPVKVLETLSNEVSTSYYFQNLLQPRLLEMVNNPEYYSSNDIKIKVPAENNNWKDDIYALYVTLLPISSDGNVSFNLDLTDSIDYSLLSSLTSTSNSSTPVIGTSKMLQAMLKDTTDALYTLDNNRVDVASSEFHNFEMKLGYAGTEASTQWINEFGAIVGIAKNQVNNENKIILSSVTADNFDKEFLRTVIDIIDEGYATTYGMPILLRSMLIPVLEGVSRVGITFEDEFVWANHRENGAEITSDLSYLLNVIEDLGLTSINQVNPSNINITQAINLINNYQGKSILIEAIARKIYEDLM